MYARVSASLVDPWLTRACVGSRVLSRRYGRRESSMFCAGHPAFDRVNNLGWSRVTSRVARVRPALTRVGARGPHPGS